MLSGIFGRLCYVYRLDDECHQDDTKDRLDDEGCHRDRSMTSRIIHWQMSQGQVIDIMTFNSYSLQYYSF